ncbi:MAG TPA: biotin--[acetyl-CoA-carboxylase] ligase [Tenuifilaceae bacterium]|nr:biotin--[acetyl-CoA-carboxylase] ligase [Tenuifilaceae bacterium]
MQQNRIGHKIQWFDELDSTNDYASAIAKDPLSHGVVVATHFQKAGRGQRGNQWESAKGLNLLFSVILKPHFLEVQKQFLLSKAVALSLCDVIVDIVSGVSIKWPNDIYVNDKKVAGILIEHSFSSAMLDTSIVGVGLNVNQAKFAESIPNPTSLMLEQGEVLGVKHLLQGICDALDKRYSQLFSEEKRISDSYIERLYRYEKYYSFKANNKMFVAKIVGVRNSGELILETSEGKTFEYAFKEIEYVL